MVHQNECWLPCRRKDRFQQIVGHRINSRMWTFWVRRDRDLAIQGGCRSSHLFRTGCPTTQVIPYSITLVRIDIYIDVFSKHLKREWRSSVTSFSLYHWTSLKFRRILWEMMTVFQKPVPRTENNEPSTQFLLNLTESFENPTEIFERRYFEIVVHPWGRCQ